MRYVGNASLSEHIQERILTTFQQTLSLAKEGNTQEALLGCDFVLRLDPLFEPARQLQTRLDEDEGPIEVDDLAEASASGDDDADSAGDAKPEAPEAAEVPVAAEADATDNLSATMALILEQRSFEELRSIAAENQDRITADPALQEIVSLGTERHEAQPYVDSFLESGLKAKESGDTEKAQGLIEKARELDPTHPGISSLESDLSGMLDSPVAEEVAVAAPVEDVLPEATLESIEETSSDADWLDELEAPSGPTEASETVAETTSAAPVEPPAAETVSADGGEPTAKLDSESEDRIDTLLAEGQEAFEGGEYQTAIDAWSRIFLIDIDHAEASRRIELARKLKAEVERQVEEAYHEGISLLESGKTDEAREAFEKVIEMHPAHMGAREYIEKLDSGNLAAGGESVADAPPELAPITEGEGEVQEDALAGVLDEIELAPDLTPEPQPVAETPFAEVPIDDFAPTPQPRKRSFALIGTGVLVLVLVVGWFLYSKRQSFFPNSDIDQEQSSRQQIDPIERARELHEEGKTAMAVNVLRRLPPTHDRYSEAQSLIEAWEIIESSEQIAASGPSEDDLLRRDELLEQARGAADSRENLRALELLEEAHTISQLDGDDADLRALTSDHLESLNKEIELFEQGDWEYALPSLWRLYEANADNRDVRRLMVDSYYNLGLRDLQRGDANGASEKFQEALQIEPNDAELLRLSDFALAYTKRPADLLYRIFVKYHPFR